MTRIGLILGAGLPRCWRSSINANRAIRQAADGIELREL
jgi:hypothetical protein